MKFPGIFAALTIALSVGAYVVVQKASAQGGNTQAQTPTNPPAAISMPHQTAAGAKTAGSPTTATTTSVTATTTTTVNGPATLAPAVLPAETIMQQPATSRATAVEQARAGAGRPNPFSKIDGFRPFPSRGAAATAEPNSAPKSLAGKRAAIGPFIPPPPPGVGAIPGGIGAHESMTPPPPPEGTLAPNELPAPPEKPSIASKLKLVGIIGDRALFTFTDPILRAKMKWPKDLSLGTGEMFESVSVVNVTPDSVTLEEDGDRSVRELQRIR